MTLSPALFCDVCGEELTDVTCQHLERRTKIDIVFEKVIEHVDSEVKPCPVCDSVTYVKQIILQPDKPEKLKVTYTTDKNEDITSVYDVKFTR